MNATLVFFAIAIVVAVTAAVLWVRSHKEETVFDYQKALLFQKGRFIRILDAGSHRLSRKHDFVVKIDTRPVLFAVPGQEILTRDKVSIKVTAGGAYAVVDAHKAFLSNISYAAAIYADTQAALRDVVQAHDLETLLGDRSELNAQLLAALQPKVPALGLELRDLAIRDIMLPAGLKKAFGGLLEAQKEAQVALEKARGEQAVLRSLANSSRLYAEHPTLLSARLVQTLDTGEHTVVFNANPDKPIAPPRRKK